MKIRRGFHYSSDLERIFSPSFSLLTRAVELLRYERERLSEIRNSRREPSDKANRFQRALRYRNLLDGRPGRPIHSGNLCFVSPADRTAGEFDLTTTCSETPRIHVHVSQCTLLIYRVRANFGNTLLWTISKSSWITYETQRCHLFSANRHSFTNTTNYVIKKIPI